MKTILTLAEARAAKLKRKLYLWISEKNYGIKVRAIRVSRDGIIRVLAGAETSARVANMEDLYIA